jgi:hypothetical protein
MPRTKQSVLKKAQKKGKPAAKSIAGKRKKVSKKNL